MDFVKKIGEIFDGLNESTLWGYIKSVIAKLKTLMGEVYGEKEVADILDAIFPEA